MKLFKGHAVMSRIGHEAAHVVRTYLVIAETWQEARARILEAAPCAEFVTVPREMPDVLLTDVSSVTGRELQDLRSACVWSERKSGKGSASQGEVARSDDTNRSEKRG